MTPRPLATTPFPYTTLFRSRQGTALLQEGREVAALQVLHDDVGRAVLEGSDVEHARHVRALQLDRRPRLALEALLGRSEEHTSELQSQSNLVCRLLLEKKNS